MREVINVVEKEWGIEIIAFTTDASGKSRKARRLLSQERPHIIMPDCYAYQVGIFFNHSCRLIFVDQSGCWRLLQS